MNNLCIDMGNTRVKLALFNDGKLQQIEKRKGISVKTAQKYLELWSIDRCIISSVRNYDESVDSYLADHCQTFVKLTHLTLIPITNNYQTPQTLGRDRLSAVIGANSLYPNENILVIDSGTCIKFDFIDAQACYWGGAISPGMAMRFKAMHTFTDQLPLLNKVDDFPLIGNSTKTSMESGALWGVIAEVDGIIDEYLRRYEDLRVLCTGGDGHFFESRLKNQIFVQPNLVLIGLNKIIKHNATFAD